MALNWPVLAGQRGVPDPGKKIGDPGARGWETWKEGSEAFRPDGVPPELWDAPERIPMSCAAAATGTLPAALTDPQVASEA